jgi:hypothetical protein
MHPGLYEPIARDRMSEMLAEAKERDLARMVIRSGPTLRARLARRLFEMAVLMDGKETWRAVWEQLEAPRQ